MYVCVFVSQCSLSGHFAVVPEPHWDSCSSVSTEAALRPAGAEGRGCRLRLHSRQWRRSQIQPQTEPEVTETGQAPSHLLSVWWKILRNLCPFSCFAQWLTVSILFLLVSVLVSDEDDALYEKLSGEQWKLECLMHLLAEVKDSDLPGDFFLDMLQVKTTHTLTPVKHTLLQFTFCETALTVFDTLVLGRISSVSTESCQWFPCRSWQPGQLEQMRRRMTEKSWMFRPWVSLRWSSTCWDELCDKARDWLYFRCWRWWWSLCSTLCSWGRPHRWAGRCAPQHKCWIAKLCSWATAMAELQPRWSDGWLLFSFSQFLEALVQLKVNYAGFVA